MQHAQVGVETVTAYAQRPRRSDAFTLFNERDTDSLRYRCDNKWACSEPYLIPPPEKLGAGSIARHRGVRHVDKIVRPTPPSKVAGLKETDRPLGAQVAPSDL